AGESLGRGHTICEESETRRQQQRSRESCHSTGSVTVSLSVKGSVGKNSATVVEPPSARSILGGPQAGSRQSSVKNTQEELPAAITDIFGKQPDCAPQPR